MKRIFLFIVTNLAVLRDESGRNALLSPVIFVFEQFFGVPIGSRQTSAERVV